MMTITLRFSFCLLLFWLQHLNNNNNIRMNALTPTTTTTSSSTTTATTRAFVDIKSFEHIAPPFDKKWVFQHVHTAFAVVVANVVIVVVQLKMRQLDIVCRCFDAKQMWPNLNLSFFLQFKELKCALPETTKHFYDKFFPIIGFKLFVPSEKYIYSCNNLQMIYNFLMGEMN